MRIFSAMVLRSYENGNLLTKSGVQELIKIPENPHDKKINPHARKISFKIRDKSLIFTPQQPIKTYNMRKYLFAAPSLILVLGSCRHFMGKKVRGNGNIKTEDRSVSNFKNVEVSGAINVYVSQGQDGQHSFKIEGDENLLPFIELSQEGDRLIVRNRPGFNLEPTGDMKIYVTTPVYNNIEVSGACNIIGESK